ncbi:MAG: hypothetical protein CSB44_09510 [Gammaproteobacteria bacterium]|nr:MAG: hypothetical protein CSB44_09510 [Gammaproteobacteria bacterium]
MFISKRDAQQPMKSRRLPQGFRFALVARVCALALATVSVLLAAQSVFAATAAGTQIRNLATVTYEDINGITYSAQSNEAIVTVAQVYSATIGVDVDRNAAPGQTVYLSYVLTNSGNGSDDFTLSVVDGISGGDTLDADSLAIYRDTNGSAEPDAGEPEVSSLTLAADEIVNLVVAAQVPATATPGQTIGITLNARAGEGTGNPVVGSVIDLSPEGGRDALDSTNESRITVTTNAALVPTISAENTDNADTGASTTDQTTVVNGPVRLVKTVARDADCDGTPESTFQTNPADGIAPGECAIWQVVAENRGSSSAWNVIISDSVTSYSTYEVGSLEYCASLDCTPASVTDAAGDDAGEIVSGNVLFFVGNNIAPAAVHPADRGGELVPGEHATARFRVRVD